MFDRNGELAFAEDLLNIGGSQKADDVVEGAAGDSPPKTPNPWSDIKIYGEVSLTHTVIPQATEPHSPNLVISSRVDYAIGRVLHRANNASDRRKRNFYSLLLLVEAKSIGGVEHALPQLIVYLASLHQSRLQRNRKDVSAYGVVLDGFVFIFVNISHDGTVMRSRLFDVFGGEMKKVLLFLKHILETASGSPTSALERTVADKNNDEADESDPALDGMTIWS